MGVDLSFLKGACFGDKSCQEKRDKLIGIEQQKALTEYEAVKGSQDKTNPTTLIIVVGVVAVLVVVGVIFAIRKIK